jgi:hypothetical protein
MEEIWLKALGTAAQPLPAKWLTSASELLTEIRFPAHHTPSLEADDLVLYYAVGWQRLFAAARLTQDPTYSPTGNKRWPWQADVEVFLLVPDLRYAPHVTRAGVETTSLRSKSHIRLDDHQYREGVAGLAEAAAFDDERYAALAT